MRRMGWAAIAVLWTGAIFIAGWMAREKDVRLPRWLYDRAFDPATAVPDLGPGWSTRWHASGMILHSQATTGRVQVWVPQENRWRELGVD